MNFAKSLHIQYKFTDLSILTLVVAILFWDILRFSLGNLISDEHLIPLKDFSCNSAFLFQSVAATSAQDFPYQADFGRIIVSYF